MVLAAGDHRIVVEFSAQTGANLQFSALRVGLGRPMGEAEIAEAARVAAAADVAVVCVGRSGEWDTEGSDLESIRLPGRQDDLVAAVLKANRARLSCCRRGGRWNCRGWRMRRPSFRRGIRGRNAGMRFEDVLFGAEPGDAWRRHSETVEDNPTWSQDPEVYPGLNGKVRYEEGVFVGYRHYDRHGLRRCSPLVTDCPIPHGDVGPDGGRFGCAVTVRNTGARAGSTVVQVYVGGPAGRPVRWLAGFTKVALEAGMARELRSRYRTVPLLPGMRRAWLAGGGGNLAGGGRVFGGRPSAGGDGRADGVARGRVTPEAGRGGGAAPAAKGGSPD